MSTPPWLDRTAWPYAPNYVTVNGARLHYVDEGDGPLVVLVHGTPTWSFEWRHVIAGLRGRCRVVAMDHLGFGLSDRPPDAGYRPEDHAARFRAFIATVCPAGPLTLIVHDFGGPIALDWALDHPERLTHLVVLNSWMWSLADDTSMRRKARLASSMLGRWLYRRFNASLRLIMPSGYGDRRRLTPAVHGQYLALFPDAGSRERVLFTLAQSLLGSSAFYDGLWQRRARLADSDLHLIWGMRDSAFPPAMLARWQLAFPHAHTTALADAGHWPHEEAPDLVVRALGATVATPATPGT
ncbi:MAG TPA: alpha/beta fold hydrolase [Vicinamibacterales bacterium]|nr:alpha/beta fold hydrolase [Vicinamibacterales bacterium]